MTLTNILLLLILSELAVMSWNVMKHRKLAEREYQMKYSGPSSL